MNKLKIKPDENANLYVSSFTIPSIGNIDANTPPNSGTTPYA